MNSSNAGVQAYQRKYSLHQDERQHSRIKANLTGRYMLADRREFECTVIDVALGGIALIGPVNGMISERVVAYIDQLGRVQGDVVRYLEDGFALKLTVSPRATEKLAVRFGNLQAHGSLQNRPGARRQEPPTERDDKVACFTLALGEGAESEVLDLSRYGADVKTRYRPPIGSPVQLGLMRGTVDRHTKYGVAVEFDDARDSVLLTSGFLR